MKLLGWTVDQWAEAMAWFARVQGYSPLPNLRGAREVQHLWMTRRSDAPSGRHQLIELPLEERPRRAERDVLMCDDPRLLPPLPLPRGIEENPIWAHKMFINGANSTFGVHDGLV